MERNTVLIDNNEKIYLDGLELKHVEEYVLSHSASNEAELTITLTVNVGQVGYEL